jgi:hypothetical protein
VLNCPGRALGQELPKRDEAGGETSENEDAKAANQRHPQQTFGDGQFIKRPPPGPKRKPPAAIDGVNIQREMCRLFPYHPVTAAFGFHGQNGVRRGFDKR